MRKIEFRGKRKDNGEWVYGYPCYIDNELIIITGYVKQVDGSLFHCNTFYFVIPETIGQFTGLHDKNGKEIYEGDIIEVGDMKIAIGWNSKTSSFHGLFMIGNRQMDTVNLGCLTSDDKIIGNIHDNPELLKEVSHEA